MSTISTELNTGDVFNNLSSMLIRMIDARSQTAELELINYINTNQTHPNFESNLMVPSHRYNTSSLLLALDYNFFNLAKILIERYPKLCEIPNIYGQTCLMLVLFKKKYDLAEKILRSGYANIGSFDRRIRVGALYVAIKNEFSGNNFAIVREILSMSNNLINMPDINGRTCLMLACILKRFECVSELLLHHAAADNIDLFSRNSFCYAVLYQQEHACHALLNTYGEKCLPLHVMDSGMTVIDVLTMKTVRNALVPYTAPLVLNPFAVSAIDLIEGEINLRDHLSSGPDAIAFLYMNNWYAFSRTMLDSMSKDNSNHVFGCYDAIEDWNMIDLKNEITRKILYFKMRAIGLYGLVLKENLSGVIKSKNATFRLTRTNVELPSVISEENVEIFERDYDANNLDRQAPASSSHCQTGQGDSIYSIGVVFVKFEEPIIPQQTPPSGEIVPVHMTPPVVSKKRKYPSRPDRGVRTQSHFNF